MIKSIKEAFKKIQDDPPGKRFIRQYQRRQEERKGIVKKLAFIITGIVIVLVGIFMLPAPGPGMLVIFVGLGIISQESRWMARLMDKFELRIRAFVKWLQNEWNESSIMLKIILVVFLLLITAVVIYGAYWFFFMR